MLGGHGLQVVTIRQTHNTQPSSNGISAGGGFLASTEATMSGELRDAPLIATPKVALTPEK